MNNKSSLIGPIAVMLFLGVFMTNDLLIRIGALFIVFAIIYKRIFFPHMSDDFENPLLSKVLFIIAIGFGLYKHLDNVILIFMLALISLTILFGQRLKPHLKSIGLFYIVSMLFIIIFQVHVGFDFSISGPVYDMASLTVFFCILAPQALILLYYFLTKRETDEPQADSDAAG